MKLLKASVLLVLTVLLVAPVFSLSCMVDPDKYTVHCPSSEACEEDFKVNKPAGPGMAEEFWISPGNLSENTTTRELRRIRYQFQKVENTELPSAEKALSESKNLCPSGRNIHLYSREEFQKEGLKHQANCYKTNIREGENYYRVTREATEEPLYCVRKHEESMIAGGDRSWIGPIETGRILTGISWLYQLII